MSYGLKVWDAGGVLMMDETTRITRVLGSVSTGTAGGSATFPFTAAGGTPWWSLIVSTTANGAQRPVVTLAGDTLTWAFSSAGTPTDCKIIVGVY